MQLILISGLSGSGKSIALNVLEDAGLYCVDNLPVTLLPQLVVQLRAEGSTRAAVAVDVRSGSSIKALPEVVEHLRGEKVIAFRKKRRKGFKKKQGHRQELTRLKVEAISA